MARQRFGGTFGTLLYTTLSQVENLKESATRAARGQRDQLAIQLLERKRNARLAALGARVLMHPEARNLAERDPEIAAILDDIDDLDDRLGKAPAAASAAPATSAHPEAAKKKTGVWRPVVPASDDDDDDLERYMVDGDVADK
ncbi:MAG TPA: hypothetical protein VFG83_12260 [Kofleriaceae bacterium]|nr:hypothetical protein [Kofleriaceae bacterium]